MTLDEFLDKWRDALLARRPGHLPMLDGGFIIVRIDMGSPSADFDCCPINYVSWYMDNFQGIPNGIVGYMSNGEKLGLDRRSIEDIVYAADSSARPELRDKLLGVLDEQ